MNNEGKVVLSIKVPGIEDVVELVTLAETTDQADDLASHWWAAVSCGAAKATLTRYDKTDRIL